MLVSPCLIMSRVSLVVSLIEASVSFRVSSALPVSLAASFRAVLMALMVSSCLSTFSQRKVGRLLGLRSSQYHSMELAHIKPRGYWWRGDRTRKTPELILAPSFLGRDLMSELFS